PPNIPADNRLLKTDFGSFQRRKKLNGLWQKRNRQNFQFVAKFLKSAQNYALVFCNFQITGPALLKIILLIYIFRSFRDATYPLHPKLNRQNDAPL
ncbi:MAG: hypothetical protein Q7U59_04595, partial [Lutibacter sp.]|nr:hypothetical protein [Lutibacter sp.]